MTVLVPTEFADAVRRREGPAGQRWLDALPALLDRLVGRWRCRPDGAVRHGQVAIVLPVRSARYGPAVVKVSYPTAGSRNEARALRALGGTGAVRVLAADGPAHALLLERAGPATLASVTPTDRAIELAGALARRLAVPAPPGTPALAAATRSWEAELDRQLALAPDLVPAAAVDRARATLGRLRADTTPTLLHGDLHFGNVLAAGREPWLAIDPVGWRGSAAFDAFTVVTERTAELGGRQATALRGRIRRYAAAAGVDAAAALACCQARATSALLHQYLTGGRWFDEAVLRRLATIDPESADG